mgnify:CR=1 FL=1
MNKTDFYYNRAAVTRSPISNLLIKRIIKNPLTFIMHILLFCFYRRYSALNK